VPSTDVVLQPITASWTRGNRQAPRPRRVDPIKSSGYHRPEAQDQLYAISDNNFTGQCVNIHASRLKNFDAMMSIEDRPIGPNLERVILTRFE
jgi:hypothetical protein